MWHANKKFSFGQKMLNQIKNKNCTIIKSLVFVLMLMHEQYVTIAQTFLLFNNDDLVKYDTTDCEHGEVYLLNYRTAFECQDGQFIKREGFIPYGMIADAVRRYAFEQMDAGVDSGSAQWSVCRFKWRKEQGIKYVDIDCPDSIKWFKVCEDNANCGNLQYESIYSKELLRLDSHRIYIHSMGEFGWVYALILKQEENDPFKHSGKLAMYHNDKPVFESPIEFTIPDSVYPDLLDVPILNRYDTTQAFLEFLLPLSRSIGLLRCEGGKCRWAKVVRTISIPYIISSLSGRFAIYFDDGKLKVMDMNNKNIQIVDSFPNYLYLYLTASPRSYYWCEWCRDYKLWILNPFSTMLYRYKFEIGNDGVVSVSKESYVLDSTIYDQFLRKPSEIDSIYMQIKAMCDAEEEAENTTKGSMFIKGVLADSILWVSTEKIAYPCEKYAFPEEIYLDEIFMIGKNNSERYFLIQDEACINSLMDSLVALNTGTILTMDIVPIYYENNTIVVYTTNTLESIMKGVAGRLRKFMIVTQMKK